MKILNIEDGIKKLYIQISDIINMSHLYKLKYEFLEDIINNNKMNNDFIEISNPTDIDIIQQFEFIIDYKKYKNISIDEYNSMYQDCIREISKLNEEMLYHNKKKKMNYFIEQIDILSGQIRDLFAIVQNKYTDKKINLPVVADCDKDWYKVNNYIIKQSLDPNSIIIETNNNEVLNEEDLNNDNIHLFNEIIRIKDNSFNQDIYCNYSILHIDDKKALIIYNYDKNEMNKEMKKAKKI